MHKAKVVQPLVYVDACVYIDLVMKNGAKHAETGEERWKSAAAVFDAVNENDIRLASSSLVEAEVGCNGEARKDKQHIRDLLSGWFTAGRQGRRQEDERGRHASPGRSRPLER